MLPWLAAIAVLLAGLFIVVRRAVLRPGKQCPEGTGLYPECLYIVTIVGGELSVKAPDGAVSRVTLRELRGIAIETTDSGPAGADVWWLFFGPDDAVLCTYPGGATGESSALRMFQTLPGFDNVAVIDAMGSTSNRRFAVYRSV